MTRSVATLILLCGLVLHGPPASAQTAGGDRAQAAVLVDLLTPPESWEREITAARERFIERLAKANKGREAEIGALFDETVLPVMRQRIATLREARIAAIAASADTAAIAASIAFWSTPEGQAVLAVPRSDDFGDAVFDGMRNRLGLFDGLAVKNRMDELSEAVAAASAARTTTKEP